MNAAYAAEGDSITMNYLGVGTTYPDQYFNGISPPYLITMQNFAVAGSFVSDLVSRAASVDALIPINRASPHLLTVLCGRNDIGSVSPNVTQYLTDLAAYCDARRAAGWKVILGTLLPSTATNFNTNRATVNTGIRKWTTGGTTVPGVHADAIFDLAADATIGTDAAGADTLKFYDGTHPTVSTIGVMYNVLKPVLDAYVR